MILRSFFLAALFTGLALFPGCHKKAATVNADGHTRVRLATDWYPQPEHGGYYTALAKGFYQEAGLDVTILSGNANSSAAQKTASGSADFGLAASDDVAVTAELGLPLIAVAPTFQHDPQGIMVHPESGIETIAQLEGHTVATIASASWFLYASKAYNWKNVKIAPVTFSVASFLHDPNYIQQVFVTSEPFFVRKAGVAARVLPIRDTGFDSYRVLFVSKPFREKNPAVVQAFVTASIRGWKEYLVDPAPAHAAIQKLNPDMDLEKMSYSWQALKDGNFITGDDAAKEFGKFDPARWKKQYDILKGIGVLKKDLGAEAAYTMEYLEKP